VLPPLSLLALAWIGAVLIRDAFPHAMALIMAPLALAIFGMALVRRARLGISSLFLCFSIALLRESPEALLPAPLFDGEPYAIEGFVNDRSWVTSGSRITIALRAIERAGIEQRVSGKVWARLTADSAEPLAYGDVVRISGRLHRPRGFLNPGGFDEPRQARSVGVGAVVGSSAKEDLVRYALRGPLSLLRVLGHLRARLAGAFAVLPSGPRGLVIALITGDRAGLDLDLEERFRRAGVSHLLSVSGLHLATAAFLFFEGLRWLLLWLRPAERFVAKRWAALVALPATIAYTLLCGAEVATVRACLATSIWLLGIAFGRATTPVNTLLAAAFVLLGVRPSNIFDVSFQLSFAAALGTTMLVPRLIEILPQPPRHRWLRSPLTLLCTSICALLSTTPLVVYYFSEVSPVGVIANLVIVPLAELLVVPLGLFGGCASLLRVPGATSVIHIAGLAAEWIIALARWFAGWLPPLYFAAPTVGTLLTFYLGLTAFCARRLRKLGLLLLLTSALLCGWQTLERRASTRLRATFLDVGQGDACVVTLPGRHTIVIDGGGSFDDNFDPGKAILAPFLHRIGVTRVDLIILSHPHPDHANGLGSLLDEFEVGMVWTNRQVSRQPGTLRLLAKAAEHRVSLPVPTEIEMGGVRVEPLAPLNDDGVIIANEGRTENDNSLVVRISYAGRRLLFPGDVEADGEKQLLTRARDLGADVLKVPHHGSSTSSSEALLAAVHPSVAVISVGRENRWGFPHDAVLARYRAHSVRVLRTDLLGAVTVSVEQNGQVSVDTVRSENGRE
jgi:competence protein ComEC